MSALPPTSCGRVEPLDVRARSLRLGLGEQAAQRDGGVAAARVLGHRIERGEQRRERAERCRLRVHEHQRIRRAASGKRCSK